ncbi:putative RNA-directed DNA polymerase [Tanacetum coccineum]|uniref:RNA-directed DNA polymerase n=1 Tax=Tanacetum coccineum TaxID=301880 RepID=A0ABQ5GY95_9ASTR
MEKDWDNECKKGDQTIDWFGYEMTFEKEFEEFCKHNLKSKNDNDVGNNYLTNYSPHDEWVRVKSEETSPTKNYQEKIKDHKLIVTNDELMHCDCKTMKHKIEGIPQRMKRKFENEFDERDLAANEFDIMVYSEIVISSRVICEDEAKRRNSGAKTKTFEENCYLLPYAVSSKGDTAYQRQLITRIRIKDQFPIRRITVHPYAYSVLTDHLIRRIHQLDAAYLNFYSVAFDENRCYFLNQDLNLKNVIEIGEQCKGLYYYNDKDPILNVLNDSLNIDKKDYTVCCEICQRAKQTRELFPLSDHTSKRFFLTVVDDYTRAVWVYLIKSKDEVPYFITVFYNLIENKFKSKIKVFRSDNGTEFVNQSVTKLCFDKGIIHQTSYVYTSQQNRIVERKLMHLLNVYRSLMFQGGIPLRM